MKQLNDVTRNAVMQIFNKKGIKAADTKILELLSQCEHWKGNTKERGDIKGELSEIALECHLLLFMKAIPFATCVKSLCIKSKDSNATAEIDILFATPYKVYLFECKSFKGDKVLSKECYLKGQYSEKDIYEQSKYHLQILEQYLAECRPGIKTKVPPYQLILFELSSDTIDDQRTDKWKQAIPAITLSTLDSWLQTELTTTYLVQWDYTALESELKRLDATSAQMFEYHMKKINSRKDNT